MKAMGKLGLNLKQWLIRDWKRAAGLQPWRVIRRHPLLLIWLVGYICVILSVLALVLAVLGRMYLFGQTAPVASLLAGPAFARKVARGDRRTRKLDTKPSRRA